MVGFDICGGISRGGISVGGSYICGGKVVLYFYISHLWENITMRKYYTKTCTKCTRLRVVLSGSIGPSISYDGVTGALSSQAQKGNGD